MVDSWGRVYCCWFAVLCVDWVVVVGFCMVGSDRSDIGFCVFCFCCV